MGYILMAYPTLETYFEISKFAKILKGKLLESKAFMITVDKDDVKSDQDLSQWKVIKNEVPSSLEACWVIFKKDFLCQNLVDHFQS